MLTSSASSSNDTLHFSPLSLMNSASFFDLGCFVYRPNSIIFSLFNITNIFLLLPLSIFILHHGLQQWRKSRSASSASMSHSDAFTYHLVTMEIIGVFGCFLNICSMCTDESYVFTVGIFLLSFTYFGEVFFHILTCLERYLAVVHPITYLSLRKERGIRIRNICIGCVWLLCSLGLSLLHGGDQVLVILNLTILLFSLIFVSFCSLSVLCVLVRPGPGHQAGLRERADQKKQRAFYSIAAILGMLVLRFAWELARVAGYILEEAFNCEMMMWTFWLSVPSRLVLPLLFLLTRDKLKRKCICYKCHRN